MIVVPNVIVCKGLHISGLHTDRIEVWQENNLTISKDNLPFLEIDSCFAKDNVTKVDLDSLPLSVSETEICYLGSTYFPSGSL
jgi:hypothetical protein